MTYEIVWADQALAAAQAYMDDDPDGLARTFDVVDLLAHDPRPDGRSSGELTGIAFTSATIA